MIGIMLVIFVLFLVSLQYSILHNDMLTAGIVGIIALLMVVTLFMTYDKEETKKKQRDDALMSAFMKKLESPPQKTTNVPQKPDKKDANPKRPDRSNERNIDL